MPQRPPAGKHTKVTTDPLSSQEARVQVPLGAWVRTTLTKLTSGSVQFTPHLSHATTESTLLSLSLPVCTKDFYHEDQEEVCCDCGQLQPSKMILGDSAPLKGEVTLSV